MNVVEIKLGREPAASARLEELVGAVYRTERLAALRSLAAHALAVLGAVVWVGLNFPGALPGMLLRVADGLFALTGVLAIVVIVRLHHWQNFQRRAIDTRS